MTDHHSLEQMDMFTSVFISEKNFSKGTGLVPYQFLYASQLYQTIFAVYGTFNFEKCSSKDKICLKDVTLRLVNYKGPINLGLTDLECLNYYDNSQGHNIYFGVQACSKKLQKTVTCEEKIEIVQGEPTRVTFNRILIPMDGKLFDPKNRPTPIPLKEEQEYFDEEFHFRDNPNLGNRPLMPGMYGYQNFGAKCYKEEKGMEKLFIPSPRCHQGFVNMFYI